MTLLLDLSGCRPNPRRRRMLLEQYELAALSGARQGLSRLRTLSAFFAAESAGRNKKEPVEMKLAACIRCRRGFRKLGARVHCRRSAGNDRGHK